MTVETIKDLIELEDILRGSGVLEFHILVDDKYPSYPRSEIDKMIERLRSSGPAPQDGDTMRWYLADRPEEFKVEADRPGYPQDYNGKRYVLASMAPNDSMTHDQKNPWSLTSARGGHSPETGENVVDFEFDAQGAGLFGKLTSTHIKQPLAIILDDKLISAPNINSTISSRGQITHGGKSGFSIAELKYLVNTLSAGSLPARLSDDPISERTINPTPGAGNFFKDYLADFIGLIASVVVLLVICMLLFRSRRMPVRQN